MGDCSFVSGNFLRKSLLSLNVTFSHVWAAGQLTVRWCTNSSVARNALAGKNIPASPLHFPDFTLSNTFREDVSSKSRQLPENSNTFILSEMFLILPNLEFTLQEIIPESKSSKISILVKFQVVSYRCF